MTNNPWGTQPMPPGPLPPTPPPMQPGSMPPTVQPPPMQPLSGQRPPRATPWSRVYAIVAAVCGVALVAVAAFFIGRGTDDAAAPTAPTTAANVQGTALATQTPSQSVRPSASPLLSKVSPSSAATPSAQAIQTAQAAPPPPAPPAPAPPPAPEPPPGPPVPEGPAFPPPEDAVFGEYFSFVTPSGSVLCRGSVHSLDCATEVWNFVPPIQCDPGAVFIMSMDGTNAIQYTCNFSDGGLVDTAPAGSAFTTGVYACVIDYDGANCWHMTTGNGFYLSADLQYAY